MPVKFVAAREPTAPTQQHGREMPLEGLCSQTEAWWFYFGWSRIYDRMQPYFTSPEMREAGLNLADVAAGQRVLDVGAGTGTLSLQVSERVGAASVTMLDQSSQMLANARAKPALAEATIIEADAQAALPFEDGTFDRVVSSGVLYYFPQPAEALREQLRVTRVGGRVLAMGLLQPKPLLIRLLATTFNRFPTEEQYVAWFEQAGLRDVRTQYITNPWNAGTYAIAIVGTKTEASPRPEPRPPPPTPASRLLRKLAYFPLALLRFGLAMGAFVVVGPLQIFTAMAGMRRLRQQRERNAGLAAP